MRSIRSPNCSRAAGRRPAPAPRNAALSTKVEEIKRDHAALDRRSQAEDARWEKQRRNWKPLCAGRATSHVAMSQDAQRIDPSVPAPGLHHRPRLHRTLPSSLREEAPSGGRWIHEIKFDGYRAQAHLRNGQPTVYLLREAVFKGFREFAWHAHASARPRRTAGNRRKPQPRSEQ